MICRPVYTLADNLLPDFDASPVWVQDIAVAWAERILMKEEDPPDFLHEWKDWKKTYHNKREEIELLKQCRMEYENIN